MHTLKRTVGVLKTDGWCGKNIIVHETDKKSLRALKKSLRALKKSLRALKRAFVHYLPLFSARKT